MTGTLLIGRNSRAKPVWRNVLLPFVAGAVFLAGCAEAGTGQTNTAERNRLSARLRASEKASVQIESRMVTARQHLAAAYPAGTVTVPGEVVGQSEAADESVRQWQDLRGKLERSRQEQQRLRAKLRHANGLNPPPPTPIRELPAA